MVCLDGDSERALALVERLVGASLVSADEREGEMRYHLLETVRQYAVERLGAEAAEQTRRAHAQYFLAVADSADLTAVRRRGPDRLDIAIAAQDNLRSALAWSISSGSVEFGLELATSLERFWVTHDPHEGMRWFAALLDLPEAADVGRIMRANALRAYGGAAGIAGQYDVAEGLWQQSLELFEELEDEHGQAVLLHRLGISAMYRGDLGRARELVDASLETHERRSDRWGQAQTLGTLGAIARDAGDDRRAFELIEVSSRLAREVGVPWWEGGALAELADLCLNADRIDDGESRARESLALAERIGDRAGRVFGIGLMARVAAERGQHERAAYLWAAVEDEDAGAPLGGWRRHRETYQAFMRKHLAPGASPTPDRPSPTLDEAVELILQPPGARDAS
jgi:non-specific serine/threonine protein kinase